MISQRDRLPKITAEIMEDTNYKSPSSSLVSIHPDSQFLFLLSQFSTSVPGKIPMESVQLYLKGSPWKNTKHKAIFCTTPKMEFTAFTDSETLSYISYLTTHKIAKGKV